MRYLLLLLLLACPATGAQEELPQALARPSVVAGELRTARFRILHTQRAAGAARALAERIESARDGIAQVLGRDWPGETEVRVGVDREEFEALALSAPPGFAVGMAWPEHRVVLLDARVLNGPEGDLTLRHELAHVALGQWGADWPRWFQEGMAQHLTCERLLATHYAALFRAVSQERTLRLQDLSQDWPEVPSDVALAYAQSAAFVAHLASRFGPDAMGQLLDDVGAGEPFERAFEKAFRTSLAAEESAWLEGLALRYGWLPVSTTTSLLWLGAALLAVAAWWRRRRSKAARLAAMAAEEAAEEPSVHPLVHEASQAPPLPPGDSWTPGYNVTSAAEMDEDTPQARERPPKPTLH